MMTPEELTAAENDFAHTYYGVAFAKLRDSVQIAITIMLQKNAERESVTPDIGVTDEQFYAIALDACYRAALRLSPIGFHRTAPATRAAIALGLRNTLREIEAQATDEARVLEGQQQ